MLEARGGARNCDTFVHGQEAAVAKTRRSGWPPIGGKDCVLQGPSHLYNAAQVACILIPDRDQ